MNYYTFFQILIVSIAATSAMTLFRYAISTKHSEIYKEPVLLTYLFSQLKSGLSIGSKKTLGWLMHFSIGFIFVLTYHLLWRYKILDFSVISSILLGFISGITGVLSMAIIFKIIKYTLTIDFKSYYIKTFIAYLIFTLYAAAVYYVLLTIFLMTHSSITL
ncbi:hypothetical protein [Flavobacterium aestuarii]|uniref:hypothetical protein n=1 Tax=Flavobacterium aestuarii TaxID=3149227 RepID=UPI0032B605DE